MENSLLFTIGIMVGAETFVRIAKRWFDLKSDDVPYFVATISFIISLFITLIFQLGFEAFADSVIAIVSLLGFNKIGKKITAKTPLP